ncbi:hypothetical protein BDW59DRAFT_154698 [Aspergillus cavernicola]|uniref:Cyclohexanone monooxygenase n=1 Tax=Aspergillus cavernicola TaxID=176166 RepID=A0ABR4HDS5_9EURO
MAPSYDVLIVGAGFGGIHQLYSLLQLGLTVKVVDKAAGLGGTWYWNRYPGAMSDSPSHLYRYSWDQDDLQSYPWSDNYLDAKDVLAYLEHVVDRHGLRKHLQFNTELLSAKRNPEDYTWGVETSQGPFQCHYLITALGLLSEPNWPNIPGRELFRGDLYHTSRWPDKYDFTGKRVAVIGNGATGIQLITRIAPEVGSLLCFQRHPQYSVPARRRTVTQEERDQINNSYDEIWNHVRDSAGGMGVTESKTNTMSVSPAERERVYQAAWDEGGPFRFCLGTFADLYTDEAANHSACEFFRSKIAQIVQDPEKRRKLTPTDFYARRPVCDSGYFEQFNRDNVDIVDILETPIVGFTSDGLKTSDGTVYMLDMIICATGFNAFDGPYKKLNIVGRDGVTLNDHWRDGPSTNMGMAGANFPNLFMINGPQAPLANVPPAIEGQVGFITRAISHAEAHHKDHSVPRKVTIESTKEGEDEWGAFCNLIRDMTLFKTVDSYYFGGNIEGKRRFVYVFLGGLNLFLQKLKECEESGYSSFHPF